MSETRGDVVVRVRAIAEDMAGAAVAAAQLTANAAAQAAEAARRRAGTHPLAGRQGPIGPLELLAAVGTGSALRETALTAARRAELADGTVEDLRRAALAATVQRRAAERLVERRIAAVALHEERRQQRTVDENAAAAVKRRV